MKLFFLIIIICLLGTINSGKVFAEQQPDSLQYKIDQLKTIDDPEVLLNARLEVIKYVENSDYALFLELSNQNLELARKENLNWAQIDALMELGESFIKKGNYGVALKYLNEALTLAQIDEYHDYVGWVTLAIGNAYEGMYNFKRANEFYQFALDVFTETKSAEGIALASTNIGNTYLALADFENSKKFLEIGLEERLKLEDPIEIGYVRMFMAWRNMSIGEFVAAKKSILELIGNMNNTINENTGFTVIQAKDLIGDALCLLSICEDSLGLVDLKYKRLYDAKDIFSELNDPLNVSTVYNLIGLNNFEDGQYEKAIAYADSSIQYAAKNKILNQHAIAVQLLSDAFFELGKHEQALKFQKEYLQIHDSMYNESVTEAISNVEVFVGTITKEKDNQILKLTIAHQKKVRTIVFIGLGLLIFLLIIVTFHINLRYRRGKLVNKRLQAQNKQIEEQGKSLKDLNEELHKLVISKDKFHSIIAHDLRNPVGSVHNSIELLAGSYDELPESTRKELILLTEQTSKKTLKLLENLLAWSRVQGGHLKLNEACFEITKEVSTIIENLKHVASEKSIEVEVEHNGEIEMIADKEMIATVVRNLFSNAVKFTPEGKKIVVGVKRQAEMVEIWVEDQGIGIPSNKIKELFLIDSEVQRPGTNNESGTGLGLQLSYEFVKLHNGYFDVTSEELKGSRFAFFIPLNTGKN